jgi:hypothetical protein
MILVEILECVNVNLSPLPHKRTQRQSRYEAFAKGAEDQVGDGYTAVLTLEIDVTRYFLCVLKIRKSIHPAFQATLFWRSLAAVFEHFSVKEAIIRFCT